MSKPSAAKPAFLALSCVVGIAPIAHAQDTGQQSLGGVTVTDTAIDETEPRVKVDRAESPKYTRPLLDTPQTITVISNKTLQQQNLLTLREVLSTVPGITFAAGEGGFGYGDRINLRGYSANSDISVDGVRSGAIMSRNETYNIEQVEVTNGANSVFQGGGSIGGSINLVTKKPLADQRIVLDAGIGTDNYYRGTVDANLRVNDLIAFRLNAVYHENDVPGREVESYKRWGIAPAITLGIDSPTRLTIQAEYLDDKGMPQYGIPYFASGGGLVDDINREGYYGFRNVDQQNSKTKSLQAIFEHEFSDTLRIRNLTRYEKIRQDTITSQPAGVFCAADGETPTGGACTAPIRVTASPADNIDLTVPAGFFVPTGGRGNTRRISNETAYNQLDLSGQFDTGGIEHTFVLGGSALWENYNQINGNSLRTADGYDPYASPFAAVRGNNAVNVFNPLYNPAVSLGLYYPIANMGDPNSVIVGPDATTGPERFYGNNEYVGPINFVRSGHSQGQQTTYAAYLFDTMKFSDSFELNGGLRYERFSGWNRSRTIETDPGATFGAAAPWGARSKAKDSLFSYRIGAVFKPSANTSVYVAYGNSRTPSKASVDGSCTAATTCNTDPESAKNYEIGAKADLFDGTLQLAAAVFRNERDKYRVASGDPTLPEQVLDGKSRVDGISLSATGNITPEWSIFANYMYLDSKLIRGVSQFCLENPGEDDCSNTPADPNPGAGEMLNSTPKHSGSLFTSYRFPFGLEVGYGATYQGKIALNPQAGTTNGTVYQVGDYVTHRLMVAYFIQENLKAQLNIQNLTDAKYLTTVRTATGGNSWGQPGVGRSAVFSINYAF